VARRVRALALALSLLAGAAAAEPALVFAGADWRFDVEAADVTGYQAFTPPGRGIALVVSLNPGAAERLARLTGESLGETVTVADREGAVLLETVLAEPIARGMFAVTLSDPDAARTLARRLAGAE